MNLKNLFASIGVIVSSLFSPYVVKANVIGDLTSNELLSPSFQIDSMLVSNYSNSAILWANYPQTYDTLSLSNGQGSAADPIGNSFYISAMKQSGYTGIVEPLRMAKIVDSQADTNTHFISDLMYNNYNSPFGIGGNYSTNRFSNIDFDFAFNDLIIQKSDLFNTSVLLAKNKTTAISGVVDYEFSFTLNSKTTSAGGEWVISKYNYSRNGTIDMSNVVYEEVNIGSSYVIPYIYYFDLFDEFDNVFADEGDTLWLSNFNLTLSLGTHGLWGVGWSIPYYNPELIVQRGSFNKWLTDNDLLESDINVCPSCPECEICPICPGDTNVNIDFTSWIATAVGGFLAFEIFPGFSLVGILAIFISISVVIWILKMIAGG